MEARDIFLAHISASIKKLGQDIEEAADKPLNDELRERTLALLGLLLQSDSAAGWAATRDLILQFAPKMEIAGFRDEWIAYLERSLSLSHQAGDRQGQAALGHQLGILYQLQSRWLDATHVLQTSAGIYHELNKNQPRAYILNRLGFIEQMQGNLSEAEQYAQQALDLLSDEDHERHFGLFVLGVVALDRSDWQFAESCFRQSLAICNQNNDTRNAARRYRDIGLAFDGQNQLSSARDAYEQAILMFDKMGDPFEAAVTKMNLGIVYSKLGNPPVALDYYSEAAQTFRAIQDELQLGHVLLNQGVDYQKIGCITESERATKAALLLLEGVGSPALVTLSQTNLGDLYIDGERYQEAVEILCAAQNNAEKISDPVVAEYYRAEIRQNLNKIPVSHYK